MTAPAPSERPVLSLCGVWKHFGMAAAIRDMSLDLFAGEVHAIVGENGAGKSTMIKIMTGVHPPSRGGVEMDAAAVTISGPSAARALGIAAIYQEPMVFPDLDVAENIFISSTAEGWFQNRSELQRKARELIDRIGMRLDVERIASGLTVAEQQAVEIARALSQNVRVLIMDEPTAALSAHEAAELRGIAVKLARQGVAVVYITHRLEEIFDVADRVTVIRDGLHISTRPVAEVTPEGMIAEMVGREVETFLARAPSSARDEVVLSIRDLALAEVFSGVRFDLRRGEVLCLAGLVGARRTDVALAIFGIRPATGGAIRLHGKEVAISGPRRAMSLGIAYVSEDRRKLGLAMSVHIRANITLATLGRYLSRLGLLDRGREREAAEAFRQRLNIRAPNVEIEVGNLSGGNQQKVMLSRWLAMAPEILIFDEPTRGIDIGAKAEVHELIRDFVAQGGAAIVVSSDLPEVLSMGDRILVMREGRQMAILDGGEATQEQVMALATGQTVEQAA